MLYHRHKAEWQREIKKKDEVIASLQKMCQRSLMEKKKVAAAVENAKTEDKENKPPNQTESQYNIGDFLRKKSPSNPLSINFQKLAPKIQNDIPVILSSRFLGQSIGESVTVERPSTAAGPKHRRESEFLADMLKKNKALGVDLGEMFKKKKTNFDLLRSGARSPTSYDYPSRIFDTREKRLDSSNGGKKSEIENILINLLEEHREVRHTDNKLSNKVAFIEKAIKG